MGEKHKMHVYVGRQALEVDFKLLRKQTRALLDIKCPSVEVLGLLVFLDAFQDAAADVLGAKAVFGKDA